ncbi:hypothetical protein SLNSH_14270 [Alsobacter soli]|uniref:Uncharacterized protein n=1 Tax=Alsobacter soli TaxID=2109933 RepID=A0A2T1HSC2_9HYPH|nr:hypothetical protein SLNSH_14270 [Alsobacter soli]
MLSPESVEAFQALALGLAFAGMVATGFEALTERRASFTMLETGGARAIASVPFVVATAPFIILRNTVRGRRTQRRRVTFVALATIIACLWGLACGRVIMDLTMILGS